MWTSTTIGEQRTDAVIIVVTVTVTTTSSTVTGIMTRLSSYRRPTLWLLLW